MKLKQAHVHYWWRFECCVGINFPSSCTGFTFFDKIPSQSLAFSSKYKSNSNSKYYSSQTKECDASVGEVQLPVRTTTTATVSTCKSTQINVTRTVQGPFHLPYSFTHQLYLSVFVRLDKRKRLRILWNVLNFKFLHHLNLSKNQMRKTHNINSKMFQQMTMLIQMFESEKKNEKKEH